jgi:hypothetical protein
MEDTGSLVARAQTALARLGEDEERAHEQAWTRVPWTIAITGPGGAALINLLVGEDVLDPEDRAEGALLRVRRGPVHKFCAVRDDGTTEDHTLVEPSVDRERMVTRVATARTEVAAQDQALERVAGAVPAVVRQRPAWWQVWLWPVRWLLAWRARARLSELRAAEAVAGAARRALADAEHEVNAAVERRRQVHARYAESLRTLAFHPHVREIVIDVTGILLGDGIEIVELGGRRSSDEVDAVLAVEQRMLVARGASGTAVPIGPLPDALAGLPELAAKARAVRLARRACETLDASARDAAGELARAEAGFQERFRKLDALRIRDLDGFLAAHRLKLRTHVVAGVHAVIEHGAAHLGQEFALLGQEWLPAIAAAKNGDELSSTISRIEQSSPQVTERITEEVRLLLTNGAAGLAHDLFPQLVELMQPHGLTKPPPAPALKMPTVQVLPSLAGKQSKIGGAGQWLAGLFRSFDSKRQDVHTKAKEWLDHVRDLANAELLDVEPQLHAAVAEALGDELTRLVTLQSTWLDGEQAELRETVLAERASLAPLQVHRDRTEHDRLELVAALGRVQAALPEAAAAAA